MKDRIKGENVEINYKDTLDFFNSRGAEKPLKHKYNYVLFQDEHPELAIERDQYEKNKVGNQIRWDKKEKVLDIGCGVGRWGEEVLERGLSYVGVDYSGQLLSVARENLKEYSDRMTLIHSSAQNLVEALKEADKIMLYDKIFINGVMMYLNDEDLSLCLNQVGQLTKDNNCTLYFKETVADSERLTLNKFFSKDLNHEYTAIYRTVEAYTKLFVEKFVEPYGFEIKQSEDLFSEDLKNRKETRDYYYILQN